MLPGVRHIILQVTPNLRWIAVLLDDKVCYRLANPLSWTWFFVGRGNGLEASEAGQNDGLAMRKRGDDRQASAHRLDIAAQGRNQQVAALLQPRHAVLPDSELLGHALLGKTVRPRQFA